MATYSPTQDTVVDPGSRFELDIPGYLRETVFGGIWSILATVIMVGVAIFAVSFGYKQSERY